MRKHDAYHTLEVYDPVTGCYFIAADPMIGEYEPASVDVAHEIAAAKFPGIKYRVVSVVEVDHV